MTTSEYASGLVSPELPASLRGTLPGRYYTDPTIFAAEQALVFEAGWFCAVLAADIPAAGDFETVRVGRESVIVARGRDGAVRAHLNVCRHRGARICAEE